MNPRPLDYKSSALPAELLRRVLRCSMTRLKPPQDFWEMLKQEDDSERSMRSMSSDWNILISGWACTLVGTGILFTIPEPTGLLIGTPLLLAGFPLLLVALSRGRQASDVMADPNWSPSPESLPEAGRVMYRVDTSLDKPIRTSILCGACGEVEWVDGKKPLSHICTGCGILLWNEEED